MNLFRVDFLELRDGAGTLAHSLTDTATTRAIISLSLSAEKLQSVSNFAREPRRCEFETFVDAWITEYILSGAYELDRYVSRFEVAVYRDEVLLFSGIIDTSQLSYDPATELITFTCYDKLKLLSLYADLNYYYALSAGYTPLWILTTYLAKIEATIDLKLPYTTQFVHPTTAIPYSTPVTLLTCDYTDMRLLPAASGVWTYALISPWGPRYGWFLETVSNCAYFYFAEVVTIQATGTGGSGTVYRYKKRFRGRRAKFYNGTAAHVDEYDASTEWLETEDDPTAVSAMNEFEAWIVSMGITLSALAGSPGLPSGLVVGTQTYTSSAQANTYVLAQWYGVIYPPRLFPGELYTNYVESFTPALSTLQAMLLAYNATLFCPADGTICFTNKSSYTSDPIPIAARDLLSLELSRCTQEDPDMSPLSVFAGDTTLMKSQIKTDLTGFYSSLWSASATIAGLDTYPLQLFSIITLASADYYITELERDFVSDSYKVTAWKLLPSA